MERRLYTIMSLGMMLTVTFGLCLLWLEPEILRLPWMHVKLTLVVCLIGYHLWCRQLVGAFARDQNRHSATWYRYFNEAPSLLLIGIVVLVIVRPFGG